MANVLLIILLFISIIMIGLILIQRSEGGALGIGGGGGGGGGGLMSGRGATDMVSKMTGLLGAAFLAVCLMISIAFNLQNQDRSLLDADGAEKGLVVDVPAKKIEENNINETLNLGTTESNTVTPLAGDSKTEESEAAPEETTENKPED